MPTDMPGIPVHEEGAGQRSSSSLLLPYLLQQWPRLLSGERFRIRLLRATDSAQTRCEVFRGDEFFRHGRLYVDVVVQPGPDPAGTRALPAVLTFEKSSAVVMDMELNGLALEAWIIAAEPGVKPATHGSERRARANHGGSSRAHASSHHA